MEEAEPNSPSSDNENNSDYGESIDLEKTNNGSDDENDEDNNDGGNGNLGMKEGVAELGTCMKILRSSTQAMRKWMLSIMGRLVTAVVLVTTNGMTGNSYSLVISDDPCMKLGLLLLFLCHFSFSFFCYFAGGFFEALF